MRDFQDWPKLEELVLTWHCREVDIYQALQDWTGDTPGT